MIRHWSNYFALLGIQLAALSRPQNAVYSGVLVVIAYCATGQQRSIATCIVLYLLIVVLYAICTVLNNLCDLTADRANKLDVNPLTTRNISRRVLAVYCGSLAIVSVVLLQYLTQPISTLLCLCYLTVGIIYSLPPIRLKARGMWGIWALAACYSALPLLIGVAQQTALAWQHGLTTVVLVVFSAAGLLAKDYRDEKGDRLTHTFTPLIRHGVRATRRLALALAGVGIILQLYLMLAWAAPVLTAPLLVGYSVLVWQLHAHRGSLKYYWRRLAHALLLVTAWFNLS